MNAACNKRFRPIDLAEPDSIIFDAVTNRGGVQPSYLLRLLRFRHHYIEDEPFWWPEWLSMGIDRTWVVLELPVKTWKKPSHITKTEYPPKFDTVAQELLECQKSHGLFHETTLLINGSFRLEVLLNDHGLKSHFKQHFNPEAVTKAAVEVKQKKKQRQETQRWQQSMKRAKSYYPINKKPSVKPTNKTSKRCGKTAHR